VSDTLLAKALDALPNPVFLYDRELKVRHVNAAGMRLSDEQELRSAALKGVGDAMRCINARIGPSGCGSSESCERCTMRHAITESLTTQTILRQHVRMERDAPSGPEVRHLLVLASPFEQGGQRYTLLELVDETELVEVRGLLPLCPRCRSERADEAARERVLDYFAEHPEAAVDALCEVCRTATEREKLAVPA
jgi:PAS domain-containing protein